MRIEKNSYLWKLKLSKIHFRIILYNMVWTVKYDLKIITIIIKWLCYVIKESQTRKKIKYF